jgi:hypothetical protein
MKYILNLSFLLLVCSSCCTKKKCGSKPIIMQMYNFQAPEVDSIIVYRYVKGNNFIAPSDSSFVSSSLSGDGTLFSIWLGIDNPDFDYLIKIKGFQNEYRITDVRTEKRKCNTCVPFTPKRTYYLTLVDYQLNGQLKDDFVIEVYK